MAKKPGVLLYFRTRNVLNLLTLEEKGQILEAILDYGEHQRTPIFDGKLGAVWACLQAELDADDERYRQKCEQARTAARSRWENKDL